MHRRVLLFLSALATVVILLSCSLAVSAASSDVSVVLNGKAVNFDIAPIMVDNTAMVEVRPFADALGCEVKWSQNTQSVKLTNSSVGLILKLDYDIMTVSDMSGSGDGDADQVILPVSPMYIDGSTFVPARTVAEALGDVVTWDGENNAILISKNGYSYSAGFKAAAAPAVPYNANGHTFYFQNQADWSLPNYGSGYCWAVSYAMLISDVTGKTVTPTDVAAVNNKRCGNGAYCYHWDIIRTFGVEFISALDESSPYYGGRDSNSGGTKIKCSTEYEAVMALKEALDRNPAGVMVRYASYPHTMVAVGYEGDTILFNEPAPSGSHTYSNTSPNEGIPFAKTCVGKRGIKLQQMTFIQALAAN